MLRALIRAAALVIALALAAVPAGAQQQPAPEDRFVGNWQGALSLGAMRLRLAITVRRDSAGALGGVFVSVDQGGQQLPAAIAVHGDTLVARVAMASITYSGVLSAARDSLHGTFAQGNAMLPLDMGRVAAVATVVRPQEPKPPYPYRAEEVTFESAPGVRLAGTLTIPGGPGPFPAAVLVTGSGPQDRDEALMGHKPFLVLADYLSRHGVAVLRYDDRGVGKSTGSFGTATSADFANDAEAGVRFLRGHAGIAPDRVGIIGHSEGGLIAPMVAARSRDVAFVVMMAGPGIPGDSILLLQGRLVAAAMGTPAAAIDRAVDLNHRSFEAMRAGGDSAAIAARIRAAVRDFVASLPPDARQNTPADLADRQVAEMTTPWMRYFLAYDPRPALRQLRVPVLALNGTLDLQVPYREDLSAIDAALREGGNRDYRVVELPGLNHLFQTARTGSPAEYAAIDETLSPTMLELVASWITERFGKR